MTQRQNTVRKTALEQAIQTIIEDRRTPLELRKALAVHRDRRCDLKNREIGMLRTTQTEPTYLLKLVRSNVVGISKYCEPRNAEDSCVPDWPIAVEEEIKIRLWHNDEPRDWSIELNGQRHEHVTSETMEALVECAMIVAQKSLTRVLAQRQQ